MLRLLISLLLFFGSVANSEDYYLTSNHNYSYNSYGGIGLIETPTARFAKEGEFSFGLSSEDIYNRVYSNAQVFPWMEAVLKYTEGTHRIYANQTWKDKGLDVKIRLLKESETLPNIAFGINDFGGTGAFSSEYLVATKKFGNFDWTIGLGWGRLAGIDHIDNIVGLIDENRKVRGGFNPLGGQLNLDNLFSGEKNSIFTGFEYLSPIKNLSFKVEYDTSDYSTDVGLEKKIFEPNDNLFSQDSKLNYAINYKYALTERERLDLSIGFVRGNSFYMNLAVHSNLNFSGSPKILMGAEKIRNTNLKGADSYQALDENRKKFINSRIFKEMAGLGIVTHSVIYNGDEIAAEVTQGGYSNPEQFIDLASRVLANNALPNIKTITIIHIDNGIETYRASVNRAELISSVKLGPLNQEYILLDSKKPIDLGFTQIKNDFLYPNFSWEIRPHLNNTIQHQQRFFFWQLEALIHTAYSIRQGLYLTTDIGIDIENNFDDYTYHITDGKLHHVRQDRRKYLTEGKSGIRKMRLDYLQNLAPNLTAKLSAGYLEWMYAGLGGEILYLPDNRKWALSMDTHWVKQRDFDQKFGLQDYSTFSGFINFYKDIPFYEMRLKLSYGKFLGKDVGAMIDVSRRFSTGARLGAFAALTDCNAACVGEGSFHKGVYFNLPMDLFYVQSSTRNKTGYTWAPLTKDAGARIDHGDLYSLMTHASDEIDIARQKQWSIRKIFSGFGTKSKNKT